MLSVIIPAYNGEKFLDTFSLPSLIGQTYRDWEALVIDDGSSDETAAILRRWQEVEPRLKLIHHPINRGLAAALNSGLSASSGDIIAFLEQDDIWLPDKLEKQIDSLTADKWLADCRFFSYDHTKRRLDGLGGGNFSTLIIRRQAAERIFPLPEDKIYLGIEDGLVSGRIALLGARGELPSGGIIHLNEPLVIVSCNHKSLSRHGDTAISLERYRAIIKFFASEKSAPLGQLKKYWNRQLLSNRLLSVLPKRSQLWLRRLKIRLTRLALSKEWHQIKKERPYQAARQIIEKI